MLKMSNIKELDRIKTKDGRISTVLGIYDGTTGMEVEYSDTAPLTETIDVTDIVEIIKEDEFKTELTKEEKYIYKEVMKREKDRIKE